MPAKKQTKAKKSQSTLQWFKGLSGGYKALTFLLIFGVLGGGLAVYRSFAYAWQSVYENSEVSISACNAGAVVKQGYKVRWALHNKSSSSENIGAVYPSGLVAFGYPVGANGFYITDAIAGATSGTYKLQWYTQSHNVSLNPANLVSCNGGGK